MNEEYEQLELPLRLPDDADTILKQTKVGADFSTAFDILTKED